MSIHERGTCSKHIAKHCDIIVKPKSKQLAYRHIFCTHSRDPTLFVYKQLKSPFFAVCPLSNSNTFICSGSKFSYYCNFISQSLTFTFDAVGLHVNVRQNKRKEWNSEATLLGIPDQSCMVSSAHKTEDCPNPVLFL